MSLFDCYSFAVLIHSTVLLFLLCRVQAHTEALRAWTFDALSALKHSNGAPVVEIYGKHGHPDHKQVRHIPCVCLTLQHICQSAAIQHGGMLSARLHKCPRMGPGHPSLPAWQCSQQCLYPSCATNLANCIEPGMELASRMRSMPWVLHATIPCVSYLRSALNLCLYQAPYLCLK